MGNIKVVKGSMGAGKSAMAILEITNCRLENLKVLVVKPELDTRDGNFVRSRLVGGELKEGIQADLVVKRGECLPVTQLIRDRYDLIVVDECHMLDAEHIKQLDYVAAKTDVNISYYGLAISKTGEPFESMMLALAYADEIVTAVSPNRNKESKMYHVKYVNGIPEDITTKELIDVGDMGEYGTISRTEFYTIYDKVFKSRWGI